MHLSEHPLVKQPSVKHQQEAEFNFKEVGMRRIMSYYSPKWVAALAIFCSCVNSVASPLFGFILSKLLFVMMMPESPKFEDDRNFWCGMFLVLAFVIGIFSFFQKYLFTYVGERLTYDVRMLLMKGIIYKSI